MMNRRVLPKVEYILGGKAGGRRNAEMTISNPIKNPKSVFEYPTA